MFFFKPKKGKKEEIKKNGTQNPKILEVNLVREEVKISFNWKRNASVLIVVLFILGIFVAEIYYGLDWWEQKETARARATENDILKINQDISKIKDLADEALIYKDKSAELSRLLNGHIYWSNFFDRLEKKTLSTVKFESFGGDTNGQYSLSAKALSYAEVSWQVKAFLNDPLVKKVNVSSVSSGANKDKGKALTNGVNFSLSFELNPAIFKK